MYSDLLYFNFTQCLTTLWFLNAKKRTEKIITIKGNHKWFALEKSSF